jgi:predicted small metal-binding protein
MATGDDTMATAKHFQCPFCAFSVTAEDRDEVLKHVLAHQVDHHPEKDMDEEDIRRLTKDIYVRPQRV